MFPLARWPAPDHRESAWCTPIPARHFSSELLTGALKESSKLGMQLTLTADADSHDRTAEIESLLRSGVTVVSTALARLRRARRARAAPRGEGALGGDLTGESGNSSVQRLGRSFRHCRPHDNAAASSSAIVTSVSSPAIRPPKAALSVCVDICEPWRLRTSTSVRSSKAISHSSRDWTPPSAC